MLTILDVPEWRRHFSRTGESLRVYLDGVDVSRGSYRAAFYEDGIHGEVWRYRVNADGRHYYDPAIRGCAREVLVGRLVIAPGEPYR